jgi:AraC-like DNA-binding protein
VPRSAELPTAEFHASLELGMVPMSATYSIDRDTPDKLEAWRHIVGKVFVSVEMRIEGGWRFFGEMLHSPLDELDVVMVRAAGEAVRRTKHQIAGNPSDSCVVMFVDRGLVRISQFGRTADVVAGTLSVLDLDVPYAHEHSGTAETYFIKIPNAMVSSRFREIRDHCAVARPATTGVRGVAADLIKSLCRNAVGIEPDTAAGLTAQFLDVIGLAFEVGACDTPDGPSLARNAVRRRALAFIDNHLSDPGLNPNEIAEAIGVSLRYLQQSFADVESSVRDTLRLRRLLLCHQKLQDRRFDLVRISELAARHGFTNQSHFAASFKRQFNRSARDVRRARQSEE